MAKPQELDLPFITAADRLGGYQMAAVIAGALTSLIAAVHLAAWLAGLMADRGFSTITMKANTALCLLLGGVALMMFVRQPLGPVRCWIGRTFAAVVFVVGVLTFVENVTGWDLGIDQFLSHELPGAMGAGAPNRPGTPAALGLSLLGAALLLLSSRRDRIAAWAQPLAIAAGVVSLLGIIGFLYGVRPLYTISRLTAVAWPTAVSMLLLAVGVLGARPYEGIMAHVTMRDRGGMLIRRLVPVMILLPVLAGWVRLTGERLGWFGPAMGTAMMMLLFIVTFTTLAYKAGRRINLVGGALRESERRYHALFDAIDQGFCIIEMIFDDAGKPVDYRFIETNRAFEQQTGLSNVTGKRMRELAPAHEDYWFQVYGSVARTRQPVRFENHASQFGRWYDVYAFPFGSPENGHVAVLFNDITRRKRMLQSLHESQEILQFIVDNSPDAMFIQDTELRYVWVGKPTPPLTREDCIGGTDFDLLPREDAQRVTETKQRVLSEKRGTTTELSLAHGGVEHVYQVTYEPRQDASGNVIGLAGYVRDITERDHAEKAIRESQRMLRSVLDTARIGIFWKDRNSIILGCNQRLADDACIDSPEQIVGKTDLDLPWKEQAPAYLADDRRVIESGLPLLDREELLTGGDGKTRWLRTNKIPLRAPDGTIIGVLGTYEDVTGRKAAEEQLKESEKRFRAMVMASSDLLYRMSPDWSEMRQLSGESFLTDTEAPDRHWMERLVPEEEQARMMSAIEEAIAKRSIFELEHRARRPDGSVGWTFTRAIPVFDVRGEIVEWFGAATDVTERIQSIESLAAAKRASERALIAAEEASRAKDHFLAVLSHELRTPLAPVVATVGFLQQRQDLDTETREALAMIRRNVIMEARLIDDLLDVTRITRGKVELLKEPVELFKAIDAAVEVCKPEIQAKQLRFKVDCDPTAPYFVFADSGRLQQVFWNLLKNAVKFTPAGGSIELRCSIENEQVVVDVSDSGIGISAEMMPRLFTAFQQAESGVSRQFGGLGLGLAISKAMVDLHDGTIAAQSKGIGQGATFTVRLPLIRSPQHQSRDPEPTPAAPARSTCKPLRILLVEDHEDTGRMMELLLSRHGHSVKRTSTVASAVDLAGLPEQKRFDLLLSDLGLPDGNGVELITRLRRCGHDLPAIALSGYGQDEDIRRSRAAGFAAHLTKPILIAQLHETIEAVTA